VKFRALLLIFALGLGGCKTEPLNPPRLVLDNETDTSIQLFIQASIIMLQAYGFATIPYSEIQFKSERAGFRTIPFMPPQPVRAMPPLINTSVTPISTGTSLSAPSTKAAVKYYIRTGLRASQLICRNHLMRLDEGNQYFEFLKTEFGVASTFASGILALVNANATLTKSFFVAFTDVNSGLTAYEDYQFLSIDRDVARNLVETAQNKFAEYYLNQVDVTTDTNNVAVGGYTFSDALNAVSVIEYQCTREGIRFLLNRSINNTPSNMEIDAATGSVMFKSAKDNTTQGTGNTPPAKLVARNNPGNSGSGNGGAGKVTETDAAIVKKLNAFSASGPSQKDNLAAQLSILVKSAATKPTIADVLNGDNTQFAGIRKQLITIARQTFGSGNSLLQ
jgi:hypothetical protein